MQSGKYDKQIQIELSEDTAEGVYSNLAVIAHSSSEFIIDFIRIMPGVPKANVKSRVILAPEHAKRLLYALNENIKKYEQENGVIRIKEESPFPPVANVKGEA